MKRIIRKGLNQRRGVKARRKGKEKMSTVKERLREKRMKGIKTCKKLKGKEEEEKKEGRREMWVKRSGMRNKERKKHGP